MTKPPEGMASAREFACNAAICNRPLHPQHSNKCDATTLSVEQRDAQWAAALAKEVDDREFCRRSAHQFRAERDAAIARAERLELDYVAAEKARQQAEARVRELEAELEKAEHTW